MTPSEIIEAAMRGLVKGLLDVSATDVPRKPPSKARRPRRSAGKPDADAPARTTVIPGDLPRPGFDPEQEELPLIPPATIRDMERAMEAIQRGNGPPPGFYEPEDADTRVPLN